MNEAKRKEHPDFQGLPNITLRQLEVFRMVCHEGSFANAALELRSTRANIKRVCEDFERAVGRQLFEEDSERSLCPSIFAKGLLDQVSPLSRALRRLDDTVGAIHEKGRILRFGAAGEFFKGGLFTHFLGRLHISSDFRPCFLRIDVKRFRTALLNAECDIYFGVGIAASDRLDRLDLQPLPWSIRTGGGEVVPLPEKPHELPAGKWWLAGATHDEAGQELLAELQTSGGVGGRLVGVDDVHCRPGADDWILTHDTAGFENWRVGEGWPKFHFSAVLKKHHPYTELMPRLAGAAVV